MPILRPVNVLVRQSLQKSAVLEKRTYEKRPLRKQRPFLLSVLFGDRADGAGARAGAAAHANVFVDLELAASVVDGVHGTCAGAGTAADAGVRNFVCHKKHLLLELGFIIRRILSDCNTSFCQIAGKFFL